MAAKRKTSVRQPVQPIAGRLLEVHHGENPEVIGFDEVDHGVGEQRTKMAPHEGRAIDAEEHGTRLDLRDERVDVLVKSLAEAGRIIGLGVVLERTRKIVVRLGMKNRAHHRPTSLRALAMTSSAGIPFTVPLSSSARRRSISRPHASSIAGSGWLNASASRRSISSAACSRGSWRVSA